MRGGWLSSGLNGAFQVPSIVPNGHPRMLCSTKSQSCWVSYAALSFQSSRLQYVRPPTITCMQMYIYIYINIYTYKAHRQIHAWLGISCGGHQHCLAEDTHLHHATPKKHAPETYVFFFFYFFFFCVSVCIYKSVLF